MFLGTGLDSGGIHPLSGLDRYAGGEGGIAALSGGKERSGFSITERSPDVRLS